MKRVVRQAGIFVGLFLLVGLVRLPFRNYEREIVDTIRRQAQAAGLLVEVGSAALRFPLNFDLAKVSLTVPTKALSIPVYLDALQLDTKLLPLFLLQGGIEARAQGYSGTVNSTIGYHLWKKHGTLEIDADKLELSKHPTLEAYGITGNAQLEAKASFTQTGNPIEPLALSHSFLALKITDGSYVGGHKVKGILVLPAAEDVQVTAVATTTDRSVKIESTEVLSSLGSLRGSGTVSFSENNDPSEIDLGLTVKLTSSGAEAFAAYLALAAGLPLDSPPRDWEITVRKQAEQAFPQTIIKPL